MPNTYTQPERDQLAAILECTDGELDARLAGFATAAEEEYVRMMLGQNVYSRGQDIKVYRLSLLIRHAYSGRLPTEGQISALFQTTTTESRGLLRAVRAKFQYELRDATRDTIKAAFDKAAKRDDDTWSLLCDSENVIEALNDTISRHNGLLPKIKRSPGTAGEYEIAASTHTALTSIL